MGMQKPRCALEENAPSAPFGFAQGKERNTLRAPISMSRLKPRPTEALVYTNGRSKRERQEAFTEKKGHPEDASGVPDGWTG